MSNIPDPNSLGGADQTALKNICKNAFNVTQDDDVAPFDMDWHRTFSHWASVKTNPVGSLILIFSDTPQALGNKLGFKQIFQFGVLDNCSAWCLSCW